jgi:hypothetical protein
MDSTSLSIHPDRLKRVLLLAMKEILGQEGAEALMKSPRHQVSDHGHVPIFPTPDFPVGNIFQVQTALEEKFGTLAGRGLAMRVGRTCLKYSLREFGNELGLTGQGFRQMPLPARLKVGNDVLARFFNQFTSQSILLEMNDHQFTWHIDRLLPGLENDVDGLCCAWLMGFIQEAWNWMSGGKFFPVEERNCISKGQGRCTIVINQTPVN